MQYELQLLDKAIRIAGSAYALNKRTRFGEGHISEARTGKRGVPESWIYDLARVAGINPLTAIERYKRDHPRKASGRPAF